LRKRKTRHGIALPIIYLNIATPKRSHSQRQALALGREARSEILPGVQGRVAKYSRLVHKQVDANIVCHGTSRRTSC
jgi:hypothetical protein